MKTCGRKRSTNTPSGVALAVACLLGFSGWLGCANVNDSASRPANFSSVFIHGMEGLVAPLAGNENVRKPEFIEDDPVLGEVARFRITVSATKPDLFIDLLDKSVGLETSLWPRSALSREDVVAGYYEVSERTGQWDKPLVSGVKLFDVSITLSTAFITPTTRLIIYEDTTSEGKPAGAATFEIVNEFYYMAVLGDSIAWGNGLREDEKYSSIVARQIQSELGVRVINQVRAHNGAIITPTDFDSLPVGTFWGEVPTAAISVNLQIDLVQSPELVELVVLDGCINDIGLDRLLNPDYEPDEIQFLTDAFCYQEMVVLLQKVRQTMPNATVIVTPYYQIVSESSDLFGLEAYASVNAEEPIEDADELKTALIKNSITFEERARIGISTAINTVNRDDPLGQRVYLADLVFPPERAIFAPDPWLWGLTEDNEIVQALGLGLRLYPEDPIAPRRFEQCGEDGVVIGLAFCLFASTGHPNPQGAAVYAEAIIETLREAGVLQQTND